MSAKGQYSSKINNLDNNLEKENNWASYTWKIDNLDLNSPQKWINSTNKIGKILAYVDDKSK